MPAFDVTALGDRGSGELREREWDQSQGVTAVCGAILLYSDDTLRPTCPRTQKEGPVMIKSWFKWAPEHHMNDSLAQQGECLALGPEQSIREQVLARASHSHFCGRQQSVVVWSMGSRSRQFMLETGCYLLLSCVTSDELLNLSVLQLFTHL